MLCCSVYTHLKLYDDRVLASWRPLARRPRRDTQWNADRRVWKARATGGKRSWAVLPLYFLAGPPCILHGGMYVDVNTYIYWLWISLRSHHSPLMTSFYHVIYENVFGVILVQIFPILINNFQMKKNLFMMYHWLTYQFVFLLIIYVNYHTFIFNVHL